MELCVEAGVPVSRQMAMLGLLSTLKRRVRLSTKPDSNWPTACRGRLYLWRQLPRLRADDHMNNASRT